MMGGKTEQIVTRRDWWSGMVIAMTFVLFAASLVVKGLTHDIFLEGGVLLVSIKLIINTQHMDARMDRLDDRIGEVLARFDRASEARTAATPRG